eukprot:GHVT01083175.1.p1 GENE.GHVT01083175.1~~GHVT01083175.1.p1  ORF type:complete len:162 (+),score=27.51 GHVT01083175.1:370-855(+)
MDEAERGDRDGPLLIFPPGDCPGLHQLLHLPPNGGDQVRAVRSHGLTGGQNRLGGTHELAPGRALARASGPDELVPFGFQSDAVEVVGAVEPHRLGRRNAAEFAAVLGGEVHGFGRQHRFVAFLHAEEAMLLAHALPNQLTGGGHCEQEDEEKEQNKKRNQ